MDEIKKVKVYENLECNNSEQREFAQELALLS